MSSRVLSNQSILDIFRCFGLEIGFISLVSFLTLLSTGNYSGHWLVYLFFSCAFNFCFFQIIFKRTTFFSFFIVAFFWLGYWLKLTLRLLLADGKFSEPVGRFNGAASEFDQVLWVSSLSVLVFFLASEYVFKFLNCQFNQQNYFVFFKNFFFLKSSFSQDVDSGSQKRNRKVFAGVLVVFLSLVFALSVYNFKYHIYQRGIITPIEISFWVRGSFTWLLFFGFSSFSAFFIFKSQSRLKKSQLLGIHYVENFLTSISMLSRGFILNTTALFIGQLRYEGEASIAYAVIKKKNLMHLVFLLLFFVGSIFYVNYLRVFDFGFQDASSYEYKMRYMRASTKALFIDRWVGFEGLASVVAYPEKSFDLLKQASLEKSGQSELSFYDDQILTDSPYRNSVKPKNSFYTSLPGLLGFLYYSGSIVFVLFCVCILAVVFSFFEFVAQSLTANPLIVALFSQVFAYRLAHFGYVPAQSYMLIGTVVVNLLLIVYLQRPTSEK